MERIMRYGIVIVVVGLLVGCGEEETPEPEERTPVVSHEGMVLIPAGEFEMGDHFSEGAASERPVHTVYLDAFYMDVYEVTNVQYREFMDASGHSAPLYWNNSDFNAPDQPVIGVSWYDAVAYATWTGRRLPTEAEWEYAARGGLVGKRYPWGDDISNDDANYNGTGGRDVWEHTSPVGSFPPNGYGLYDMAGNAWEWCADWYNKDYYASSPRENPSGPSSGQDRVVRGGRWDFVQGLVRVALRCAGNPAYSIYWFGFRCAAN